MRNVRIGVLLVPYLRPTEDVSSEKGEPVHGMTDAPQGHAELRCSRPTADTLRVELAGPWRLQDDFPPLTAVERALEAPPPVRRLTFDTTALADWDSGLVTYCLDLLSLAGRHQLVVDQEGLPEGLRRMVHL